MLLLAANSHQQLVTPSHFELLSTRSCSQTFLSLYSATLYAKYKMKPINTKPTSKIKSDSCSMLIAKTSFYEDTFQLPPHITRVNSGRHKKDN